MTDVADADAETERGEEGSEVDESGETDQTTDGEDAEAGDAGEDAAGGEATTDELVARVAAADVEAAAAVEDLRRRVDELEDELDAREAALADREETVEELESKVKRARADFQNYKKRAKQREEELRERATEDLVERLLDVRDNLVRAVEQDDDVEVREGVEATLATFDRVLDAENVSAVEPAAGDEVDPQRHEVVHRTESDRAEGTIVDVYRPGYEMADTVLRPAQVTVSAGPGEGDEPEDPEGTGEAADPDVTAGTGGAAGTDEAVDADAESEGSADG